MKLNPDDPRLTAFALGALPPDEAARIEAALEEAPEARAEVEETRALAALLTEGFAAERERPADPRLLDAVQERLGKAMAPALEGVLKIPASSFRWTLWIGVAAAACILVLGVWMASPRRVTQIASEDGLSDRKRQTAERSKAPPAAEVAPVASITPQADAPATKDGLAESILPSIPTPQPTPLPPSLVTSPVPSPESGPPQTVRLGKNGTGAEVADRYGLAVDVDVRPGAPSPLASASRSPGPSPELRSRYGLGPGAERSMERLARGEAVASSRRELESVVPLQDGAGDRVDQGIRAAVKPALARSLSVASAPFEGRGIAPEERSRPGDNPGYVDVGENPFRQALQEPLSTFGLDVDTGAYPNVRRFLNAGQLPPREAVRIEEMINYFPYELREPGGDEVFRVVAEVAACPWASDHRLVRFAIQARAPAGPRPSGNFVFLVDVSGSMQPPERLPLLKQALRSLVRHLAAADRVAIVTYASHAGVHLPSTSAEQKDTILAAIDALEAGGSTNGEGGIRQAYEVASRNLLKGGINRVILCTDGDFNVGISNQDELVRLIEEKARTGVFLTTLGVGTDNFKDALMRRLADRGNGSYHYLDSFEEGQRVLIGQMDATFLTVARDAKAQVEFNPARINAWRLIGYEKRGMAPQDFNDDTKDGGEVGSAQTVTVLYEIVPPGLPVPGGVDGLKYQRTAAIPAGGPARELVSSRDLMTLKLRYQRPEGSASALLEIPVADDERSASRASTEFRFAAAVASFGMVLRQSPNRGSSSFDSVLELARDAVGRDPEGWRAEFLALVRKAREISR